MTAGVVRSPLLASFRDSYRDLLRYLAHRIGSADEARDVAHDIWLRLAELPQQPALQDDAQARAYVFAMARNLATDRQRRVRMVQRHADAQGNDEARSPDAAEALMYGQAIAAIEGALAGLPERVRQVFLRNRVHGESQAALASEYGVSRNLIERDMMLAMDRVQSAMERWHAGAAAGAQEARRSGRRRSVAALLGMAGLGVGGMVAWRSWRIAVPQWQQVAAAGHGQLLRRVLPDGSQLTLDALSRAEMSYYASRRAVRLLEGAAFFEVMRDADRPFVVEVPAAQAAGGGAVRVTVLGTRFGVERLPGGDVSVQVESGRVRVEALDVNGQPGAAREIEAGQALHVKPGPEARRAGDTFVRVDLLHEAASWRHGRMVFSETPLAEAIERLRRYLPRPVDVDAQAGAMLISGQVRVAQGEDFLLTLPRTLRVRTVLVDGRWDVRARNR